MTEVSARNTQVASEHYRVRFRDQGRLTVREAANRLDGLGMLAFVAGASDVTPTLGSLILSDPRRARSQVENTLLAMGSQNNPLVMQRMTYNSPLEVVFWINVGVGSAYVAVNRALNLYERWQDIRIKRAMANREEFSAARFILDELGIEPSDSSDDLKQKDTERQLRQELRESAREAGETMEKIEQFEKVDDRA